MSCCRVTPELTMKDIPLDGTPVYPEREKGFVTLTSDVVHVESAEDEE